MMDKTKQKRILLIEDEEHIAQGIALNLKLYNHNVHIASNGQEGLSMWKSWRPELIILDLMMPEVGGVEVLEKIREEDDRIPILILTAKDAQTERIKCLSKGGDDYLTKPFDLEELLLRVDRLLKRSDWSFVQSGKKLEVYNFGHFNQIDFTRGIGKKNGVEFSLTAQELKVLKAFIESVGVPLSRKELLQKGWGYDQQTSTRTVDNFIVRFRKYFEDDQKNPKHFKSVRSVGYVFIDKENIE